MWNRNRTNTIGVCIWIWLTVKVTLQSRREKMVWLVHRVEKTDSLGCEEMMHRKHSWKANMLIKVLSHSQESRAIEVKMTMRYCFISIKIHKFEGGEMSGSRLLVLHWQTYKLSLCFWKTTSLSLVKPPVHTTCDPSVLSIAYIPGSFPAD